MRFERRKIENISRKEQTWIFGSTQRSRSINSWKLEWSQISQTLQRINRREGREEQKEIVKKEEILGIEKIGRGKCCFRNFLSLGWLCHRIREWECEVKGTKVAWKSMIHWLLERKETSFSSFVRLDREEGREWRWQEASFEESWGEGRGAAEQITRNACRGSCIF